jgi:hypothetical protein
MTPNGRVTGVFRPSTAEPIEVLVDADEAELDEAVEAVDAAVEDAPAAGVVVPAPDPVAPAAELFDELVDRR